MPESYVAPAGKSRKSGSTVTLVLAVVPEQHRNPSAITCTESWIVSPLETVKVRGGRAPGTAKQGVGGGVPTQAPVNTLAPVVRSVNVRSTTELALAPVPAPEPVALAVMPFTPNMACTLVMPGASDTVPVLVRSTTPDAEGIALPFVYETVAETETSPVTQLPAAEAELLKIFPTVPLQVTGPKLTAAGSLPDVVPPQPAGPTIFTVAVTPSARASGALSRMQAAYNAEKPSSTRD